MKRALAAAALCLAVAACATPQTDALRQELTRDPAALPKAAAVKDPVFFAQRTKECGPASLAMVLVQSGVKTDPDRLVAEVYNPGREGSLAPAMLAAARRAGRIAYPINDLKTLFAEIDRGRPVVVLENLGLQWYPVWHYAVVVGYDLGRDVVILHSGRTPYAEMRLETFERTWARVDYWGLTMLKPGQFPDGADPFAYTEAVAGVERAGRTRIAEQGYAAAAARWPDNYVARMGLGNTLYALGHAEEAVERFEQATRADSSYVEAWNNMGNVLAELGRAEEAVSAYRRALSLAPDYADAHFNLAETLHQMGDRQAARVHFRAYLAQDPASDWADQARERLLAD